MKEPANVVSEERFVDTVLGRLWVRDQGHGDQTIVLWPSIFTDHQIYDRLVGDLGDHCRFLTIDGPGHGRSFEGPGVFTMADCGRSIIEVLNAFGVDRAIIGGTSWGGLAAAHAGLVSPDRVQAVILMNTPMQIGKGKPSLSTRMIAFGARWMLKRKFFRDGVARSFFRQESLDRSPDYATAFHAMLSDASPPDMAGAVRSVMLRGTPLIDRIGELSMPVLVVAGEEDVMYPLATQTEAAQRAQNGVFKPVPGKHISVVDAPHEVASVIEEFLNSRVGG